MAAITADMVKTLREKTGAGMMDCKKALEATNGDLEAGVDWLRKSGMVKAETKAGRTTKEGMTFYAVEGNRAAMVEILCETDFVARNDKFRTYGAELAAKIANNCTQDGDVSAAVAEAEKENLASLIAVIGENMQIRRVLRWQTTDGQFSLYNHQNLSKCCVLLEVAGEVDATVVKDAAMHIAAFMPRFVAPENVPAAMVDREKDIAAAQVTDKPANMVEKIVAGKINKWYTEVCLLLQPWMRDDKTCLAKVAPKLVVRRFVRWQVGETL